MKNNIRVIFDRNLSFYLKAEKENNINKENFQIKIYQRKNNNNENNFFIELFSEKNPFFYFSNKLILPFKTISENQTFVNNLIKKLNDSEEKFSKVKIELILLKEKKAKIVIKETIEFKQILFVEIEVIILPQKIINKIINSKFDQIRGYLIRKNFGK